MITKLAQLIKLKRNVTKQTIQFFLSIINENKSFLVSLISFNTYRTRKVRLSSKLCLSILNLRASFSVRKNFSFFKHSHISIKQYLPQKSISYLKTQDYQTLLLFNHQKHSMSTLITLLNTLLQSVRQVKESIISRIQCFHQLINLSLWEPQTCQILFSN